MKMGKFRRWTVKETNLIIEVYVEASPWYSEKWDELADKFGISKQQLKNRVDYLRRKGVLSKEQHKKIKVEE